MHTRSLLWTLTLFSIFLVGIILAGPNPKRPHDATMTGTAQVDNTTYINGGNILMFVTNHGSLGRDIDDYFGYDYGTFFPYAGDPMLIFSGDADALKSPLYDCGIWLGGYVGDDLRLAISEYTSEFVPGPMANGTFQPDNPAFKVYKLYSDSLATNPNADYSSWPADQGAPVGCLGRPRMRGGQMLWCVYNDADTGQHINDCGGTLPLGIEVRQTVWTMPYYSLRNSIFIEYLLLNKGENTITDFHFAFWADPDLGLSEHDLGACDSLDNIFYCYKRYDFDPVYYNYPPALGFKIIHGLLVPAAGETAIFGNNRLFGYKNLGMTSFSDYTGYEDPWTPQQSYNLMQGLHMDGSEYTYLSFPTRYFHSGDPVTAEGDLDNIDIDKKIVAGCGPITFAPGDSQCVFIEMAVGAGLDRLASVTDMRNRLDIPTTTETTVWPGDLNHDGTVAANDVYSLAQYWSAGGPIRDSVTFAWAPQTARGWNVGNATHADADGNGCVDIQDLAAVCINWGRTATGFIPSDIPPLPITDIDAHREAFEAIYTAVRDATSGPAYEIKKYVSDILDMATPSHYALKQNYPNPFNPTTTIHFDLPEPTHVSLSIFNILGQPVATLLDQSLDAGSHTVVWNGIDDNGRTAASGMYVYRLKTPGYTETRTMTLVK